MKAKASDELRMCVSMAAAVLSAHSASNVLELPEPESKLNASNAFVFWNPIEIHAEESEASKCNSKRK